MRSNGEVGGDCGIGGWSIITWAMLNSCARSMEGRLNILLERCQLCAQPASDASKATLFCSGGGAARLLQLTSVGRG